MEGFQIEGRPTPYPHIAPCATPLILTSGRRADPPLSDVQNRRLPPRVAAGPKSADRLSVDIRDDQVISLFDEGEHVLGLVGVIEAFRAVRTSSVAASSAICGKMALRLLRWAPSSVSVMASVTIVSS
jgi:hypothetical protein